MIPAQPVATSVAVGPDGAYYVGELKGFPAPTGESRVWRIEPGARNVQCGESKKCTLVLDGFTSIIDLTFGPDGRLNVAQIDDASWLAMEVGVGLGGSVRSCDLATDDVSGECDEVAAERADADVHHVPRWRPLGRHLGARARGGASALRGGRRPAASDVRPLTAPRVGRAASPARAATLLRVPRKVMLIGLDCAEPSLVLERWRDELPTISSLMERGVRTTHLGDPADHGPGLELHDVEPDAGRPRRLRFRNRSDHSYDGRFIATSTAIEAPRLWDLVTRAGGSSIVLGVPRTYPPRPLKGVMVSCFLTPSLESGYTYPPALRDEIADVVGSTSSTKDFRTEDKAGLLGQIYEMTDRRFALAQHLLETRPWQLFAMVEMGPDRMHAFWKFMDPEHRKHEPGSRWESAILDYHRHLDGLIARLLEHADEDTVVFVLSDHGAKRLDGGIRINEWLRREGLLATLSEPDAVTSLDAVGVDWPRTTAWGEGGYYARVFLNVKGREPDGVVGPGSTRRYGRPRPAPRGHPRRREQPDPDRRLQARGAVRGPQGIAPDLIVVFGDLLWRSVGTIGGDEGIQTLENDTGPDDANHAQDGLYVVAGPGVEARGRADAHLLDIAPTVLELLEIEEPPGMRGAACSPCSPLAEHGILPQLGIHLAECGIEVPVADDRCEQHAHGEERDRDPGDRDRGAPGRIPRGMAAQAPALTAPKAAPQLRGHDLRLHREEQRVDPARGEPATPSARSATGMGGIVADEVADRHHQKQAIGTCADAEAVPDRAVHEGAGERGPPEDAEHDAERPRASVLLLAEHRGHHPGAGASTGS